MRIIPGDLNDPQITALLRIHLTTARASTAPGSAHALGLSGLQSPDIAFYAAWNDDLLLAIGALKRLSPRHGEVKSMHTAQVARRNGAGTAMLRYIVAAARAAGLQRLSLETGAWNYFSPAHALYKQHGFVDCPPFNTYKADSNSLFMTLDLSGPAMT